MPHSSFPSLAMTAAPQGSGCQPQRSATPGAWLFQPSLARRVSTATSKLSRSSIMIHCRRDGRAGNCERSSASCQLPAANGPMALRASHLFTAASHDFFQRKTAHFSTRLWIHFLSSSSYNQEHNPSQQGTAFLVLLYPPFPSTFIDPHSLRSLGFSHYLLIFSPPHLLQPRPHPSSPSHLSSCRPTLEPSPTTIRYHPPVYHHSPSAVPLVVKLAPPPSPFAHLLSAFSRSTSQPSGPLSIPQRILTRPPGSGLF